MRRIIRYAVNKIYTICLRARGLHTSSGSQVHCRSDIRYPGKISLGKNSILYKKQCIYPSKNGTFSMGDRSHAAPYGYFLIEDQKLSIGDDVAIGPYCCFFCSSNTYSTRKPLFRENYEKGDITIGNNVFIGAQSVILPGSIISDNVIVAAHSSVKGKLESGYIYGGSPCKPIKKLSADD